MTNKNKDYMRWFRDLGIDDVPAVGGKNASLGELYSRLTVEGVRVPNGFAITAEAYRDALTEAGAWDKLHGLLDISINVMSIFWQSARRGTRYCLCCNGRRGSAQRDSAAYRDLKEQYGASFSLAVRSSATAEDLPNASFAGQHESFLNVRGETNLIEACRNCFASIFTDRAIVYRLDNGFDHFKVALSVGVMKMVRSDIGASGVIFTLDTESGFRDVVFITGSYGLGENVVQGRVDPDEFYVHKPTFKKGFRAVLRRTLGNKKLSMIYADDRSAQPHATS